VASRKGRRVLHEVERTGNGKQWIKKGGGYLCFFVVGGGGGGMGVIWEEGEVGGGGVRGGLC